jgi:hypothetical protein
MFAKSAKPLARSAVEDNLSIMKIDPNVSPFIYEDVEVTPERLDRFGNADRATQVAVLTTLRLRANDSSNDTQIAVLALVVSTFGIFLSPASPVDLSKTPLWVSLVVGAILGFGGALVAVPFLIRPLVRSVRRERARVWMPAFEDEIARRRALRGRAARKWQHTH